MLLCTRYKPIDDSNMTEKCIIYKYLDENVKKKISERSS